MSFDVWFPNLGPDSFAYKSKQTVDYNCVAYAAGDESKWWEPSDTYYWPDGVEQTDTVDAFVKMFESLGYETCDSKDFEPGFERVAIYGDDDTFTHAARQIEGGKWVSKLGELEDIEHDTLAGLEGGDYGSVKAVLRRPVTVTADSETANAS